MPDNPLPSHLHLVLVMPVYNEAECIEQVITAWHQYLGSIFDKSFGLMVVNDGSTDNTGDILQELEKKLPTMYVVTQKNAGHGSAVVRGYQQALAAQPDYVFQTDSDDQFVPSDFNLLWQQRERSDFILGHRKNRKDPFMRLMITRVLKGLLFLRFGKWIKDANIPFRLMTASFLAASLPQVPPKAFAPNIFLSVLAAKKRIDVLNIPVQHKARETGSTVLISNNLWKACVKSLRQLLSFRPLK